MIQMVYAYSPGENKIPFVELRPEQICFQKILHK